MRINKKEFDKHLINIDKMFSKIITYAESTADCCYYDFNNGDKSVTLITVSPSESFELTTREGLEVLRVVAFTTTTNEGIVRDIMTDKPQITASISTEGKIKIELFEGADEEVVKSLTEKLNEMSR